MNATEYIRLCSKVAEVGTDLGVLENDHLDPLANAVVAIVRLGDTKKRPDWERDLRPALVCLLGRVESLPADLLTITRKVTALVGDLTNRIPE